MYGLIVPQPHLGDIIEGRASWDRRAFSTRKRGRIALIDADANMILGFADLADVKKITYSQFLEEFGGHRVNADMWAQHRTYFEFVLKKVTKARNGIPVVLTKGETVWVELPDDSESGSRQRSLFEF